MTDFAPPRPEQPSQTAVSPRALLVLVTLAGAALGFAMVCLQTHNAGDEGFHAPQAMNFAKGIYRFERSLPMLPAYHLLLGLMARAVGIQELNVLRLLSGIVSLISLPVFARLARRFWPLDAGLRTAHLLFLPIAFPFFFLVYTDMWSLLAVLGMLLLTLERRFVLAGLCAVIAIALRQTAAVWLAFALVLATLDQCDTRATFSIRKAAGNLFRRGYPLLLAGGLFATFVVLNKGVALGDRKLHQAAFNPTNLYLFLILGWALFLPCQVASLPRILPLLRRPAVWVALGLGMLVYLGTYQVKHQFNAPGLNFYLHNGVLAVMTRSVALRAALFVPLAWMILSLWTMRFPEPRLRWLLLFIALSVAFNPVVDPRYYLPGLALLLAFREPGRDSVELATVFAYVPVSAFLLFGIVKGSFFL